MRQKQSSGSVKAFYLDRDELLRKLIDASTAAIATFPEVEEVRLFGSLARGDETGLSDVDIWLLVKGRLPSNPVERMKPYYGFFVDRIGIAVDVIVAGPADLEYYGELLKDSIILAEYLPEDNAESG